MANDSVGGFRVPVLDWIRDYQSEWIKPDVIAGLTAAAVVIPKAMAYATIAGLAVQVGPLHRVPAHGDLRLARELRGRSA